MVVAFSVVFAASLYGYPEQFIHVDGHRDLHEGRLAPR